MHRDQRGSISLQTAFLGYNKEQMGRIDEIIIWSNNNSGFVTVLIFVITILLGWVTGIFQSLRQRPKFKITVIEGPPTICSTFETGREYKEHKTHRTAISVYLNIVNIGSAASDIKSVQIGYHNHTIRHTFFWYWLKHSTNALEDFCVQVGDYIKVYPFLIQVGYLSPAQNNTFLEVGKSVTGISYFEQDESWGGFYPRESNKKVKVRVKVIDVFSRTHKATTLISKVDITEAREFNPQFGRTIESLGESGNTT